MAVMRRRWVNVNAAERKEKKRMNFLRFDAMPILDQLRIEEALYRSEEENFCIVNEYKGPPTIVLGISGVPEKLVHLDKVRKDSVQMIKRYSGGGTVVLAPGSFLVSFVCRKDCLDKDEAVSPGGIMQWSKSFYASAFRRMINNDALSEFELTAQDYTFGGRRKIGGNAQALSKDRWVHHTSFLWDYESSIMRYLKVPEKQPEYRSNREHGDFLCRIRDVVESSERWWDAVESELNERYDVAEMGTSEISKIVLEARSRDIQFRTREISP